MALMEDWVEIDGRQSILDQFYDIDNLVKFEVDIDEAIWDKLRTAEPRGEPGYKGDRYDWFHTKSVTISSRDFTPRRFLNVAIRKKSWLGSKSSVKPSLHFNFSKFQSSNEKEIKALIGTKRLVLNNSVQDELFVRQPLGYEMLQKAGVPCPRCNLATVRINEAEAKVYINVEPFKKPFLKNRFHGNAKSNLYKIGIYQDIVDDTWSKPTWYGTPFFKGFSGFDNEEDIRLLGKIVSSGDWNTVETAIDVDAFIKFFALETLLKHFDGFTQRINNSCTYNDTTAVAHPTNGNLNFKFIVSGIDQILREEEKFVIGQRPMLARLLVQNDKARETLYEVIREYANGEVFSDEFTHKTIDRLAAVLRRTRTQDELINRAVTTMKDQIRQVRNQANELTESVAGDALDTV